MAIGNHIGVAQPIRVLLGDTRIAANFLVLLLGAMTLPAMAQRCQWSALGSGIDTNSGDSVAALKAINEGTLSVLYVGGSFTSAGGVSADDIAKWDSSQWSVLGTGTNGGVSALAGLNGLTGSVIYAGGQFTAAGGVAANNIAKWDGTQWSALGHGVSGSSPFVSALTIFNDGTGPALYAGGNFTRAGGVAANNIAKWNGRQWSALSSGTTAQVNALIAFNDGTGTALYAGGGPYTGYVAKWDGKQWSQLSSFPSDVAVRTLQVFNDGTGSALYAGTSNGLGAGTVAKWDGVQWSTLGNIPFDVFALTSFGNSTGLTLYAAGKPAPGQALNPPYTDIAKWNGTQWSMLPGFGLHGTIGGPGTVLALAVFDGGSPPALIAGGMFDSTQAGVAVNNIASWSCTP